MKAFVICERTFDLERGFKRLADELKSEGINLYSFATAYELVAEMHKYPHEPVLFYPNVWTRYEFPRAILDFHFKNPGFESLRIKSKNHFDINQEITYFPKNIGCYNNTIVNRNQMAKGAAGIGHRFDITNFKRFIVKPTTEAPHVFVNCHSREMYLTLTLNSLIHSLSGGEKVTLLLNGATEAIKKLADEYAKKYNFIDILDIQQNTFYSSLNLGLQWYKPEKFALVEDDFIFPSSVKEHYPNWLYQFGDRLEKYDFVGWGPSTDNSLQYHRYSRNYVTTKHFGDWEYKKDGKPIVLGNAIVTTRKFFIDVIRKETDKWYTALDSKLHKYANDYCTPTLKGYHIGWNQSMDFKDSAIKLNFEPPVKNIVKNLQTGEVREMSLKDILL